MTKKFTSFVFIFFLFHALAIAQVRFGIVGGAQFAKQSFSFDDARFTGKNKVGYQAGVMVDAMLVGNLSFRPQLLYSVKGTKYPDFGIGDLFGGLLGELGDPDNTGGSVNFDDMDLTMKATINYVELPLQLVYSVDAGPGWINLGAGPYLGYALSGKTLMSFAGQSDNQPIEFGSDEERMKRLDYGLRLSLGYEMPSGLMLTGHFSPGLANLANSPDLKVKNTTFGLSLGFLFGGE